MHDKNNLYKSTEECKVFKLIFIVTFSRMSLSQFISQFYVVIICDNYSK